MRHQKISNSLNEENDSKFVTRKWSIVSDNSKQIIMPQMKLPLKLKSSLCDCNDLYILVKGDIAVIEYQAT